jgi:hypothetical protein
MSRVWLARTWVKSNGSSGGAGRWVSLPSPLTSPSAPRGDLAPIPEAVGVVLSEAICQSGERITTMHMPYFFLKHVILFTTHVHYKHTVATDYTTRAFSRVSPNSLRRLSRLARDTSSTSEKFSIPEGGSVGGVSSFRSV